MTQIKARAVKRNLVRHALHLRLIFLRHDSARLGAIRGDADFRGESNHSRAQSTLRSGDDDCVFDPAFNSLLPFLFVALFIARLSIAFEV
jgi:hypothetical protein